MKSSKIRKGPGFYKETARVGKGVEFRGSGLIFAIRWPRVLLSFRKPLRPGPDANFMEMGYAELAWNR
jgi:hypothetical protein